MSLHLKRKTAKPRGRPSGRRRAFCHGCCAARRAAGLRRSCRFARERSCSHSTGRMSVSPSSGRSHQRRACKIAISSLSKHCFITRAGLPPATVKGGIFRVTTLCAAIMAPSPIFMPGITVHMRPNHTSLPTTVSPLRGSWAMCGGTRCARRPPNTANG